MFKLVKKFFDYSGREIGRYRKRVDEINSLEDKARVLKDTEFARETKRLKEEIQSGKKQLDEVVPWAFALVREAARRTLGQRHYDVQLIAGLALYEGKIAEQKTGEGKTLSATTALFTHALTGRGAHLVTVNDYLTRRDAGWMGGIFHLLGMTTAAIISDQSFVYDPVYIDSETSDWRLVNLKPITRDEAYRCDITYGINSEFGFDYLRDNMEVRSQDLRQKDFYFAVIDEADSILIDEARTPHIISAPYGRDVSKYYQYAKIIKNLDFKNDYVVDEKERTANLTESGITNVERALGISNIYEKEFDTLFHIEAALKAETLFKNDKDYIVKDGEVIIVDEFTGRLLTGRRFSEGIHQAIEAKENVSIQQESKTLATISLQNYFRMYEKLAGMTGTAATEAEEFNKIYKADVVVIPTHRTMIRRDHADMIYKTEKGKFDAVCTEIAEHYKAGRPVLVGTTSIEKNEYLSSLLKKRGVPHELLNAKNHEREAHIIARAGKRGAVTVATNMAGRGVDIILGGEAPSEYQTSNIKDQKEKTKLEKEIKEWQKNHDEVVDAGGLHIIGTERHESRRIDNQLRGRSGRQGDPGSSKFFVSLEDDLMRIFGGEQIGNLMTFLKFPEDTPLTHPMVSKAIEQAQVKVEGANFDQRKSIIDFDDVLDKQRDIVYGLRKKMLQLLDRDIGEFRETVFDNLLEEIAAQINQYMSVDSGSSGEVAEKLHQELTLMIAVQKDKITHFSGAKDTEGLIKYAFDLAKKEYESREKKVGQEEWNRIVQNIFLTTIDQYWMEHLTADETLRQGIGLRGYGQMDYRTEYKNEAYSMFERLMADIKAEVAQRVLRIRVEDSAAPAVHVHEEREMIYKPAELKEQFSQTPTSKPDPSPISKDLPTSQPEDVPTAQKVSPEEQPTEIAGFKIIPPGSKSAKIGRNDPCPCGSGKKWKKCHYPNIP